MFILDINFKFITHFWNIKIWVLISIEHSLKSQNSIWNQKFYDLLYATLPFDNTPYRNKYEIFSMFMLYNPGLDIRRYFLNSGPYNMMIFVYVIWKVRHISDIMDYNIYWQLWSYWRNIDRFFNFRFSYRFQSYLINYLLWSISIKNYVSVYRQFLHHWYLSLFSV